MKDKSNNELLANGFYPVVCRENGNLIDYFMSFNEAVQQVQKWQNEDEAIGEFVPNFYQILDEIQRPCVIIKPMLKHINNGWIEVKDFATDYDAEQYIFKKADELNQICACSGDIISFGGIGCDYSYTAYLNYPVI